MKRMACVIALATGTGIFLGSSVTPAQAEPYRGFALSGLQIAIAAPSLSDDAATTTLDVSFKGGSIHSIELHLDGVLVKKQAMRTREDRGVVSFSLDGLAEGDHAVLIKAFDADGNSATSTAKWKITAADTDALARFVNLRSNQQVQGVVPLQVSVADTLRNPYISFYIDNDFLAMMNYAPFTYNWDSTKVSNGPHTISVEVLDGDTTNKLKTVQMQVNVNNPGGYTKIHHDAAPLPNADVKPNTPGNALLRVAQGVAENALPGSRVEPQSVAGSLSRLGHAFAAPALRSNAAPHGGSFNNAARPNAAHPNRGTGFNANLTAPVFSDPLFTLDPVTGQIAPTRNPLAARMLPDMKNALPRVAAPGMTAPSTNLAPDASGLHPAVTRLLPPQPAVRSVVPHTGGIARNVLPPAPNHNVNSHVFVPGTLGQLSDPTEIAAAINSGASDMEISHVALRARRAGNVAVRPGFALTAAARPARPAPVPVHPIAIAKPAKPAKPAAKPAPAKRPTVRVKAITVHKAAAYKRGGRYFATFDNTPVDFDVPTRIQHGIPLTPFRQIFEHTGGTIEWTEGTQTVRATNRGNVIEFQIGKKTARVNNKNVKMESRPFVTNGRAMVPVSFLRDALNVKVTYDPATGHLLIESVR